MFLNCSRIYSGSDDNRPSVVSVFGGGYDRCKLCLLCRCCARGRDVLVSWLVKKLTNQLVFVSFL